MAHKSKTQRAKATTAKANRKEREEREVQSAVAAEVAKGVSEEEALEKVLEAKADEKAEPVVVATKEDTKPKKERFKFIKDVRAEMKRVTWPTRTDVLRWSGVVVAALIFFGVYVAILDNVIVTPALVALSGLGA